MQLIGSKEILLIFLSLFVVYLVAAMFAADGWVIYRIMTGQRVLPAAPLVERRPVPWGMWTVLLTLGLYLAVNVGAFVAYAKLTGRLPARLARAPALPAAVPDARQSPLDHPALEKDSAASGKVQPENSDPKQKSKPEGSGGKDQRDANPSAKAATSDPAMSMTEGLAVQAVINVILLILVPLVLRLTTRSPLRDLGLRFNRWWLQVAVGVVAFLAIQPVIFLIQLAMTRLWENNAHPLYKMLLDEFSPGVPQLAILMAVVVAPVFEEVLFRGIIQSWLVGIGTRRRRETTQALAQSAAKTEREDLIPASLWKLDSEQFTTDLDATLERTTQAPTLIASNQASSPYAPPSDVFERVPPKSVASSDPSRTPRSTLAAIAVTSLIFAAMHGPQWPAPIALFVLSFVIGYVYQRTGSLLAAICMHATFNGLSTLLLLGFLLVPQSARDAKKDATPVTSFIVLPIDRESACIRAEK